jgi:hypothetical protein
MQTSPVIAAHTVLSVAGFSLAAAGAFAGWVAYSYSALGYTVSSSSGWFTSTITSNAPGLASSTTTLTPTNNPAAAGAMLIIGFVLGFFHFVAMLLKGKVSFANSNVIIATSALAFVTTFIGTVVGGQVS